MDSINCSSVIKGLVVSILLLLLVLTCRTSFAALVTLEDLRSDLVYFMESIDEGQVIVPVTDDGDLLVREFTGIANSPLRYSTIKAIGVGIGIVASAGAGAIICGGPCAGIGGGTGAVVFDRLADAANRDPFVADLFITNSVSISGQDITEDIIALSEENIDYSVSLNTPRFNEISISFLDPQLFSPKLLDASGNIVTDILGVDTLLLRNSEHTIFAFGAYNDPFITGRKVQATDQFELDFGAIIDHSPNSEFKVEGTVMIVRELSEPTTVFLIVVGFAFLGMMNASSQNRT